MMLRRRPEKEVIYRQAGKWLRILTSSLGKVWESVSRDGGSTDHTSDGNHSETSVLQFLQLPHLLFRRVGGVKTKGVKAKVTGCTVVVVHVGQGRESAGLQEGDPAEDLDHGVRKSIVGIDDLGEGLEGELFSRDAEELGDNESNSGKHSSTSVLQLGLTEPWHPLRGTLK